MNYGTQWLIAYEMWKGWMKDAFKPVPTYNYPVKPNVQGDENAAKD